ncbi:hypothetical protein L6251_01670 [Candidatus Parcubacteria bacterium]|nr:hypothetical protein [Patescibacteria group bacterium]MBU4477188.1 hypothetical protein [Patescibacteria group bacterium]MCG2699109.1 hypothetical protein [Candidatus Parcubacteria bacterium]
MDEEKEKIGNLLNDSESIALFLDENFLESELLAREALGEALEEKNLTVYMFPRIPGKFAKKWSSLASEHKQQNIYKRSSILIPKTRFKIKEINYEENSDFFILNIKTNGDKIEKNDIYLESNPMPIDAAICLMEQKILPQKYSTEFSLPAPEKIIFLGRGDETIAEKVFNIIQSINARNSFSRSSIASLLFASLITETNNLKNNLNKNSLDFASDLLRRGADKKIISEILKEKRSASFAQILGRALARARINKSLKSVWAFISFEDLKKTRNEDAKLPLFHKIIKKIQQSMPPQFLCVLLWQDSENVWGLIMPLKKEHEILEKLGGALGSTIKNNFIVAGPYKNFSEAELRIQHSLKEIIL